MLMMVRSCPAAATSGSGSSVIAANDSSSWSPADQRDQRQAISIGSPARGALGVLVCIRVFDQFEQLAVTGCATPSQKPPLQQAHDPHQFPAEPVPGRFVLRLTTKCSDAALS